MRLKLSDVINTIIVRYCLNAQELPRAGDASAASPQPRILTRLSRARWRSFAGRTPRCSAATYPGGQRRKSGGGMRCRREAKKSF